MELGRVGVWLGPLSLKTAAEALLVNDPASLSATPFTALTAEIVVLRAAAPCVTVPRFRR